MSIPSPLPSTRYALPASRPATARHSSFGSSLIEDVLAPGDIIGPGILLQGHLIRPASTALLRDNTPGIAPEFEVIRKLGTGSYAVVYHVREVLSRPIPSEDGHCGTLDLGDTPTSSYVSYGREFALKCLSKANLDEDALAAQLSEVLSFPLPYVYIYISFFLGYHSSVAPSTPQHRHPSPHSRNPRLPSSAPRVRPRRGFVLLPRTGSRSCRAHPPCRRLCSRSHSSNTISARIPRPTPQPNSSPSHRPYVHPDVRCRRNLPRTHRIPQGHQAGELHRHRRICQRRASRRRQALRLWALHHRRGLCRHGLRKRTLHELRVPKQSCSHLQARRCRCLVTWHCSH